MSNTITETINDTIAAAADGANAGLKNVSSALGYAYGSTLSGAYSGFSKLTGYADIATNTVAAYRQYGWAGAVSAGSYTWAKVEAVGAATEAGAAVGYSYGSAGGAVAGEFGGAFVGSYGDRELR